MRLCFLLQKFVEIVDIHVHLYEACPLFCRYCKRSLMALKGEHVAVREMRKHASWYMKGIRGNVKIRNMINTMETADDLTNLMNDFANEMMESEQVAVGISAV